MAGTTELADILTARNVDGRYDHIIERARLGGYNDYKFDRIPGHPEYADDICPKIVLIDHLMQFPELDDIAKQVYAGAFDDVMDETDTVNMYVELQQEIGDDTMLKTIIGDFNENPIAQMVQKAKFN